MPLRDHFHPPLSLRRHWHSFHNAWATNLAESINRQLPRPFFAEPNVQYGIEIDVATWDEGTRSAAARPLESTSPALAGLNWQPPPAMLTVPMTLVEDVVEISVFDCTAGPELVGVIELVSPANKDRPESRDAFVSKCKAYLQRGVGLVVLDIVTNRSADLHAALLRAVAAADGVHLDAASLHGSSYRPFGKNGQTSLQVWHHQLTLGGLLPTIPLWLAGGPCLAVDFNETYEASARGLKLEMVDE